MGALVPFAYGDSLVRVVDVAGNPWWVATDVAKVLGYRDAEKVARILDEDEKGTHIVDTLGGAQKVLIISESGVYHAIFKSRRPEAKPFRKWVTTEVLPAIRRTGGYVAPGAAQEIVVQNAVLDDLTRRLSTMAGRLEQIERIASVNSVRGAEEYAHALAHFPVAKRNRKPGFWSDVELRVRAVNWHRQMTVREAIELMLSEVGRAPSKSALARFWLWMDENTGRGIGRETVQ